ncbi:MAG: RNA 2'-phosphotransferase, partial [Candidatus Latescibacteria bacterium]|nr:RNA 2'-phosphotransferase [Candidatus Latescibacterota bacterium]
FGVEVDRYGYADLESVLEAMRGRVPAIQLADIEEVVCGGEKKRFEIVEGRIRARYGHSFDVDLGLDPVAPPEHLYKGLDTRDVEQTLSDGLKPLDRKYVHLSFEAEVAARLGGRGRYGGAVIRVDALRAHESGIPFYDCGPTILSPEIPPEYLSVEEMPETPAVPAPVSRMEQTQELPEPPKDVAYGRRRRKGSRR